MRSRIALAATLVVAALSVGSHAAERPWRALRGTSIVVYGQQSPKTLRKIAVNIEQFRTVVGLFLRGGQQAPSMPTLVYAFDDKKGLQPYAPLYDGKPITLGGYCHCGSGEYFNFITLDLSSYAGSTELIFHEFAHQLVSNAVSVIPLWLTEGLAEYYSTCELVNDHAARIGAPIERHVHLLREQFMPIAALLALDPSSKDYNEGSRRGVFYAESWALTHYLMIERPGGLSAINKYIAASQTRKPDTEMFTAAFGVTPAQMDKELSTYVLRPVFKSFEYVLKGRVEVEEPEAARTVPVLEIEARLADVQRRVKRVEEAIPRIERAAAAGPEEAQAQLSLAFLRMQQGRAAEAAPLLRKAAALAPDDFLTQYTFAISLLRNRLDDPSGEKHALETARGLLTKAIGNNPNSAEALSWLAYTDLALDDWMPEARAAISKAIDLAPGRLDYRLRFAEISVRLGDTASATRILTPLTAAADAQVSVRARTLLDRIASMEAQASTTEVAESAAPGRTVEVASDTSAAEEAARSAAASKVTFDLRKVRPGEERAYGFLIAFTCAPDGVQFHLRVGDRIVVAVARKVDGVDLVTYGNDKELSLACGPRANPDSVYLTWKSAPHRPLGTATIVGEAIAVEFVPRGYKP